jgi:hypothetical protein
MISAKPLKMAADQGPPNEGPKPEARQRQRQAASSAVRGHARSYTQQGGRVGVSCWLLGLAWRRPISLFQEWVGHGTARATHAAGSECGGSALVQQARQTQRAASVSHLNASACREREPNPRRCGRGHVWLSSCLIFYYCEAVFGGTARRALCVLLPQEPYSSGSALPAVPAPPR